VLKLSFDRPLVDHRPDLRNPFVAELIEHVLGEGDPSGVHWEAKKETLRPAVEAEPTRDMGRFADQEFDVEPEVGDLGEIAFEHGAIAGQTERTAVVTRVVGDELVQIRPILPVQAGDIGTIEVGECGFGHDDRSRGWKRPGSPYLKDASPMLPSCAPT
jgi:hypothetical protein